MSNDGDCTLLTLDFDDHKLRLAGEELKGDVYLNLNQSPRNDPEKVILRVMGAIRSYVAETRPSMFPLLNTPVCALCRVVTARREGHNAECSQEHSIFRKTVHLWQKDAAPPQLGEQRFKLPFVVTLPTDLPPSYRHVEAPGTGVVQYIIQVTATRGEQVVKEIQLTIPVMSVFRDGARLHKQLQLGWTGAWRNYDFSKKVWKYVWDKRSIISATVRIR